MAAFLLNLAVLMPYTGDIFSNCVASCAGWFLGRFYFRVGAGGWRVGGAARARALNRRPPGCVERRPMLCCGAAHVLIAAVAFGLVLLASLRALPGYDTSAEPAELKSVLGSIGCVPVDWLWNCQIDYLCDARINAVNVSTHTRNPETGGTDITVVCPGRATEIDVWHKGAPSQVIFGNTTAACPSGCFSAQ